MRRRRCCNEVRLCNVLEQQEDVLRVLVRALEPHNERVVEDGEGALLAQQPLRPHVGLARDELPLAHHLHRVERGILVAHQLDAPEATRAEQVAEAQAAERRRPGHARRRAGGARRVLHGLLLLRGGRSPPRALRAHARRLVAILQAYVQPGGRLAAAVAGDKTVLLERIFDLLRRLASHRCHAEPPAVVEHPGGEFPRRAPHGRASGVAVRCLRARRIDNHVHVREQSKSGTRCVAHACRALFWSEGRDWFWTRFPARATRGAQLYEFFFCHLH